MIVAVMQPYFFPYLGYFSLIKISDSFIILDKVQYTRRGWINRNRILKKDYGWSYITVPVKSHHRSSRIDEIIIDNNKQWKDRILGQLIYYKKFAPYYKNVMDLVYKLFSKDYDNLVSLNRNALQLVLEYLDIYKKISVFSEMGIKIDTPSHPDDWALNICRAIGGVETYLNPSGGIGLYNKEKYLNFGIKILFQEPKIYYYNQKRDYFEPNLSILDTMMFNSPPEINKILESYNYV